MRKSAWLTRLIVAAVLSVPTCGGGYRRPAHRAHDSDRPPTPLGIIGCTVLAFALPLSSVAAGVAILVLGIAVYAMRHLSVRR